MPGAIVPIADRKQRRANHLMYNKDQWISSFEDAMVRLRPHMSARVLATVGLMAWNKFGKKDIDPYEAARDWSMSMDRPA